MSRLSRQRKDRPWKKKLLRYLTLGLVWFVVFAMCAENWNLSKLKDCNKPIRTRSRKIPAPSAGKHETGEKRGKTCGG